MNTEFKGTPRPWDYEIWNSRVVFQEPMMDLWFKDHKDSDSNFKNDREEVLANAQLIAAAPDLLEALMLAKEELNNPLNVTPRTSLSEAIKSAINKALGNANNS